MRIELGRKMRVALKTKDTVFPIKTDEQLFFRLVCFLFFAASGVEIPDRGPYCEKLDFLRARY